MNSETAARNPREWDKYRTMRGEDPAAAERGRLLAARKIAEDPEARARVEASIGVETAAAMYPEAYQKTNALFSGVARFLDHLREAFPW